MYLVYWPYSEDYTYTVDDVQYVCKNDLKVPSFSQFETNISASHNFQDEELNMRNMQKSYLSVIQAVTQLDLWKKLGITNSRLKGNTYIFTIYVINKVPSYLVILLIFGFPKQLPVFATTSTFARDPPSLPVAWPLQRMLPEPPLAPSETSRREL